MTIVLCKFQQIEHGFWKCDKCGFVFEEAFPNAPLRRCGLSPKLDEIIRLAALPGIPVAPPPDLTPILTRLAELTSHPEILGQPHSYARAAQQWAAGIPGELKPYECRDDSEVEFIEGLCQSSGCGKLQGGDCKPSCGAGMILAVKARMASEGCPWTCSRW